MVWESFKSIGAIGFLKTCLDTNILIPENCETYLSCSEVFTTHGDKDIQHGDLLCTCNLSLALSADVPSLRKLRREKLVMPQCCGGCCPASLAQPLQSQL